MLRFVSDWGCKEIWTISVVAVIPSLNLAVRSEFETSKLNTIEGTIGSIFMAVKYLMNLF